MRRLDIVHCCYGGRPELVHQFETGQQGIPSDETRAKPDFGAAALQLPRRRVQVLVQEQAVIAHQIADSVDVALDASRHDIPEVLDVVQLQSYS